ncbi:hypothetical protein AMJ48_02100 [Parcubacteria bacterium DG_74_1]|nr:MAG: hypothetical protein AMJ48_02100 [Parcubacteria bacterium DG_74_1]
MKKIKYLTISLVALNGLLFLFSPTGFPEHIQLEEFLNPVPQADVIIIFNSGGWGNTSLEEAKDFAPIIEGIQKTLNDWGYNSLVIPYARTKDDFFGRIAGAKDFLNSFESSSNLLAREIESLVEKMPDKKVIVTGLSAGGAFANETYEKISEEARGSVIVITAGTPFWANISEPENILQLNNAGKDSLAKGKIKILLFSLLNSPRKWLSAKIKRQDLSFSQAIQAPGHDYFWDAPEVGSEIVAFLRNRFREI